MILGKIHIRFATWMLCLSSGATWAQSSANYSIRNAVVDGGGGAAGSTRYQVTGAAAQAGGIGPAAGDQVWESGGFFTVATAATAVAESDPSRGPSRFALHQNYPNPFNPETAIRFEVAEPCEVSLAVYDLLGRRSSLLAAGRYAPGAHTVRFDASKIPSGIYFYRIRMGSFAAVRKMVVLE